MKMIKEIEDMYGEKHNIVQCGSVRWDGGNTKEVVDLCTKWCSDLCKAYKVMDKDRNTVYGTYFDEYERAFYSKESEEDYNNISICGESLYLLIVEPGDIMRGSAICLEINKEYPMCCWEDRKNHKFIIDKFGLERLGITE